MSYAAYGSRGMRETTRLKLLPLLEGIDQMNDGDILDFTDVPNPYTARHRLYKYLHITGQTSYYQIQMIDEPDQRPVIRVFRLRSELTKLQTIKYKSSSREPLMKRGFEEEDTIVLEKGLENILWDWPEDKPLIQCSYIEVAKLLLKLIEDGAIDEEEMKKIQAEYIKRTTKKEVSEELKKQIEKEAKEAGEKLREQERKTTERRTNHEV